MVDHSKNREEFWRDTKTYHVGPKPNVKKTFRVLENRILAGKDVKSVLELGCNTGMNLQLLRKRFPDLKLKGIDISEQAIKYGREVEHNQEEMVVGSIYNLSDFDDNSWDLVFTRGVIMHINHERAVDVTQEMKRIADKYILHLETHGKNSIVGSTANGIPHTFIHDFNALYKTAETQPIETYGVKSKGGASHVVWVSHLI